MSLLIPEQLKGCLIDFYFDVYIVPLISEILDSEKKKILMDEKQQNK